MTFRDIAVLVAFLCVGCQPGAPPVANAPARGPQIRATVVTIRTTIEPDRRVSEDTIVLARGLARSTVEQDVWRLFDMNASTITVVDEIGRTVRSEPFEAALSRRRAATAGKPPSFIPHGSFKKSDERRTLLGVAAERVVIEAGGYRRELWIAPHPKIPAGLFRMMHLSAAVTSPLAGMMHEVDDAISKVDGFPLLDRADAPAGDRRMVITRAVISVTEKEVPASLLQVPSYRKEN